MANRKDLLSEAIADAKAVKETALANAKLALEEAFTPKLQSMISAKLAEEADDEMEEELDSSDLGAGDNAEPSDDANDSSDVPNDDNLIDAPEESENDDVVSEEDEMEEMEEEEGEMSDDSEEDSMEDEMDSMDSEEAEEEMEAEEDEDDELDLESVIEELEAEMASADEEDETYESAHDEEDETYESAHDEVDEEDEMDEEDENIDLEEVIKTLKEMEESDEDVHEEDEMDEEDEDMATELEEAYSTIKSLQKTINEVNLLNAKLLYTNKLFRTFDLNENQKVKVLENFDRTSSVREVKLVFSTLAENLNVAKKKRTVVKEGFASKATKSSAPKKIISEGNELSARWKKLAGLK